MGEDDGVVGKGGLIDCVRKERGFDGLTTQGFGLMIDDIYNGG